MSPGMTVIGPHTYRKSGMSYSRTRKNRPKNSAKPPIAKYAIGSRSRRLDVLEDTLRPTKPRVLQSGVVRIRNAPRIPAAGFRRGRSLWRDRGARRFQRLADEQHAGPGDSDEAEGNHRERDRAERLRQGAAEDRSHDEPGSEDDRVNSERGSRHGVLDDVPEIRERGGRERPGTGREDDDEGPAGDQLGEIRIAGACGEREENRESTEAREPQTHERPSQTRAIGQSAAHRERETEGNPEGRDDDQELIGRRGTLVACAQQVVGEGEDVSVERDHGDVDREESLDVLVPQHGPKELERPPLQLRSEGGFLDEELDHDDAHRDAESAHREDHRVRDPERMERTESRSEPCDEAAERHEIEERH